MRTIGFHPRLLLAAFLLICVTTLILDVVGVHITRNFMYKRFNDRIEFLAKYLALNSEVSILMGDRNRLNSLVLNLLGEEDVARVTILDNQGEILVDQRNTVSGPLSAVKAPVLLKIDRDETVLFQDRKSLSRRAGRNVGENVGEVRIAYSTFGIEQLIKEITLKYIWFSIGLSIVSALVFYIISRPMVKEVKQLAFAARQVGRGDLELRVRPGKIPETRSLAIDFNTMLDSLNKSKEALDRVSREMIKQKSLAEMGKFSMMIAHEVKNPLSIIKGSLDILKKDMALTSQNTMVGYIEDEVRRLNRLIEDFLLFARPVKPAFRPVDLNALARSLIERFEMLTSESDIRLSAEIPNEPVIAVADSDLLVRGLGNILKNACEAAGDNGEVSIVCWATGDFWVAEISDSGEGISPDKLHKVFEPFYTDRATGTGLGLAFTRQVVTAHRGIVMADNAATGGAVFRMEIPLAAAREISESTANVG
ncbi:MAG: ATP-binding protein [Desulfobacterales bacterium]|jgi:signal transduction histidine kinase|nr:ATP-binding protein [Desulfobacterales bacterium]